MTLSATGVEHLLAAALPGAAIEVIDDSARHAGHGATGGHYRVRVVWVGFAGLGRVARQRLVHKALAAELETGRIHALSLSLWTPTEEG
jgi:BolA protein